MNKTGYPLFKTLKRLLSNLVRQNKKILYLFIIYTITASIYPIFPALLPKLLVGELSLGDKANFIDIIYIILGYLLLAGTFNFTKTFVRDTAYPKLSKLRIDYIRDMFDKLVSMKYQYTEDATFYNENERALEATSGNNNGVEGVYHKMFETPSTFITILLFVLFIGQLNVLILVGLILHLLVTLWINKKVHTFQYGLKDKLAHAERKRNYYYTTTHDFGYGKDIRIYNFKNRILDNYNKEIQGYISIQKLIKNKEYLLSFLGLFTLLVSDLLTYGILIYRTYKGMSIANFSMYLVAIVTLSTLLRKFAEDLTFIKNEAHYVHDFFDFMDRDMGETGGSHKRVENDTLEIEFRNVSFKYPKTDRYIFKNLNLTIHKGERLAIVGINGAGKSTLVKLMLGMFDVTEGEIFINGIPLKEFDPKELYSLSF